MPYPTGITATAIDTPVANWLPAAYGTEYGHTPIVSAGATPADLYVAFAAADLDFKEHVTFSPDPLPVFDGDFDLDSDGKWHNDEISTSEGFFPVGLNGIPLSRAPMNSPQDLLWISFAADSTNRGIWHEFVTDNPISVSLASSADGWTVTTTDNGVPFIQPFSTIGAFASIHTASGTTIPWSTPIPGSLSIVLSGSVTLTAADIASGTKTFSVTVYDDDYLPNPDDPLVTVWVTVPTKDGKPGMTTSFRVTTLLLNISHQVAGAMGSSGESTAEVFFVGPDGTYSNSISITAN